MPPKYFSKKEILICSFCLNFPKYSHDFNRNIWSDNKITCRITDSSYNCGDISSKTISMWTKYEEEIYLYTQ